MRKILAALSVLLVALALPVIAAGVAAAATTNRSVANGNWSSTSTWELGHVPTNTEKVVIRNAVTLDVGGQAGFVEIRPGKSLTFAPSCTCTLQSKGSIVVYGTLVMHPSSAAVVHKIAFTGVNEANEVGGGGDDPGDDPLPVSTDDGLWVPDSGVLDLVGATKVPWNRTGDDSTWASSDTLVRTPIGYGEAVQDESPFPSFTKGGTVPTVTFAAGQPWQTTYAAEILNLSRNVRIYGGDSTHRAHVWISSDQPQTLDYVELRYMGPRHGVGQGSEIVAGRYGFHFHKMGLAQAGRTFHGLVVRDSGSHAFVPHMSHGITLDGAVSYNTLEDAYWWDPSSAQYPNPPDPVTDDFSCTGCVAALVRSDPVFEGYRLAGFNLGAGTGNSITGSVAVGVQGSSDSGGYVWSEFGPWGDGSDCLPGVGFVDCTNQFGVWEMSGNLAHNNSGMGATVWQVHETDHHVEGFEAYHNGKAGVFNGAYANAYKWDGLKLFHNSGSSDFSSGPHTEFFAWMASTDVKGSPNEGTPWTLSDSILDAGGLVPSAMVLAGRGIVDVSASNPGEVESTTFRGYTDEAVLFSFSFHDLGDLCPPICGYPTAWHFASTNDYGSGVPFYFDPADLPGEDFPSIHEDSVIDVDGIGTLIRWDQPGGVLDPDCNCRVL